MISDTPFSDALIASTGGLASITIASFASNASSVFDGALGCFVPASAVFHAGARRGGLYPYSTLERIAKSVFELKGQTTTGRWMDALENCPPGIFRGHHRAYHGHHFIADGIKAISNPRLSIVDFGGHLATDIVTKQGLPIMPPAAIQDIASALGVQTTQVIPWVSLNIFDLAASALVVQDTVSNISSVIAGSAHWSTGYGVRTIAGGGAKIAAGLGTENPFFVACGAADVMCGFKTAVDYYSQPFVFGVPVSEIVSNLGFGAIIGAAAGTLETLVCERDASFSEHAEKIISRSAESSFLAGLSVISAPLSITVSFALSGIRLARSTAVSSNQHIEAMPIASQFANTLDWKMIRRAGFEQIAERMINIVRRES